MQENLMYETRPMVTSICGANNIHGVNKIRDVNKTHHVNNIHPPPFALVQVATNNPQESLLVEGEVPPCQ